MTFGLDVRSELAHTALGPECCRLAETSGLLRIAAVMQVRGGGVGLRYELATPVGAVARRLRTSLRELVDADTDVEVHQPTGLRIRLTYRVRTAAPSREALQRLGLVDATGRPRDGTATELVGRGCDAAAYVRGAFMGAGSLSNPGHAPHLEILTSGEETAVDLRRLVGRCGAVGARASERDGGWRVVVKSGEAVGALLARIGAHGAFLTWDAARLQRELRSAANRAANADRANVRRAVMASARQAEIIEQALHEAIWADVPDGLREVALARLANPEASLGELGRLLDPPVGKTTVHRRLARLMAFVEGEGPPESADDAPAGGGT